MEAHAASCSSPTESHEPLGSEELISLLKLRQPGIQYQQHEPLYSCEQASDIALELAGIRAKNLLLRDRKKQRYILLCIEECKRPDLKVLASVMGCSRLSLASDNELDTLLATEPGALSMLSLLNDPEQRVEVVLDAELQQADQMLCHPLSNRCTMLVDLALILQLIDERGHVVRWATLDSSQ